MKVRVPGVDGRSTPSPELPKDQVAPMEHLRRVLGEWVVDVAVLRQSRRAADAAGVGPRRGLGPRPGRASTASSARSPATTPCSSWPPPSRWRRRRSETRLEADSTASPARERTDDA